MTFSEHSDELNELREELARDPWTAHNITLAEGVQTIPGSPDFFETDIRLAAIRRILRTRFGEDLTGLRVADLGCLEGGFSAALAMDGASVVGIEARPANIARAELLTRHLRLPRLSFELGDVKDFTPDRFGQFDVVLALGIAYHLDRPARWLHQIASTTSTLIVETHVAPTTDEERAKAREDIRGLSALDQETVGGRSYPGRWFNEFDIDISDEARGQQLWASWSNHRSFWLTQEGLIKALMDAGFDIVAQHHDLDADRFEQARSTNFRALYVATRSDSLRRFRGTTARDASLEQLRATVELHEQSIRRTNRTIATLSRQLSSEPRGPAPAPTTTAIAQRELIEMLGQFAQEGRAVAESRRWKIGNRIGHALALVTRRTETELPTARLLQLANQVDGIDRVVATPQQPEEPTTPANPLITPWVLPVPRQYDVIVLSNIGWHTRQQRPQHLARAFAHHGHRVFYLSAFIGLGYINDLEPGIVEVGMGPKTAYDQYRDVASERVVDEWMVAAEQIRQHYGIDDAVIHVHLKSWAPFAFHLRDLFGWPVVYDCMDEWVGFPGIGEQLIAEEETLVRRADLVVATASTLVDKWRPENGNTVLVRNAVDADFFFQQSVASNLLDHLPHPIIGFTGGLASWVDFALIAAVATTRPEWTFVLVGDVFVEPEALHGLDEMPNVHFTGLQPYTTMPRYLYWFDVAIIPFVTDHISAAVDPVKFYEYAASGTPIVTTHLPELNAYRHLLHEGHDAASFEAAIETALTDGQRVSEELAIVAANNTWVQRYEDFHRSTLALWPVLSVIVVTYGQLAFTRRCLHSLLTNTSYPRLEVIVVDNGSTDGTPKYLRLLERHDRRVRIILNPDNRGFAAANNQGLAVASGEILMLLNNDTEVSPGWHTPLLNHLQDPTIGLVGPRSDSVGNQALIEVPDYFVDDLAGFTRHLRQRFDGDVFEIQMLAMFCVAMRRDVFAEIGPLDEGYGIGMFEDDDYAERVRAAGWRVVCARDAFVHHAGQATFKKLIESGEYNELWNRNRERFESRWGRWKAQDDGFDTSASP